MNTSPPRRLLPVDALRGLVMVLMALDHTRWFLGQQQYDPLDLDHTSTALFLTRWITHLCAPAFIALMGFGIGVQRDRGAQASHLARFVALRGLVLILLEMTVVRLGWTFNVRYDEYLFGGVIWMLGLVMVLSAPAVFLRPRTAVILGASLILSHPVLGAALGGSTPWEGPMLTRILYSGGAVPLGSGPVLSVLFTPLPWLGAALFGLGLAPWLARGDTAVRARDLAVAGLVLLAAAVAVRGLSTAGDPVPWQHFGTSWRNALSFVNFSKYPPSPLFLVTTLGGNALVLAWFFRVRTAVLEPLATIGRVPMFFYLLHLPVIHLMAWALLSPLDATERAWLAGNQPMAAPAPDPAFGLPLGIIWAVSALTCLLLYPACRWYDGVRAQRRHRWTRFI